MKISIKIILMLLFAVQILSSQNEKDKKSTENAAPVNAPFDLPNAIIYGNAQLSVGSSIKRYPKSKLTLNANELDSINSLEKEQSLLLPMSEMPKQIIRNKFKDGFILASLGMFTNAKAEAGTAFDAGEYKLHADGALDLYGGHTDNSDYHKILVRLSSDYIAAPKFWLFGGSKTRTLLRIQDNGYKAFGADSVAERKLVSAGVNLDVDGNYESYAFQTGIDAGLTNIKQDIFAKSNFDNNLSAYARIYNPPTAWNLGFESSVDIHNINANSISMINLAGLLKYVSSDYNINGKLGISLASNQFEDTWISPILNFNIDIKMDNSYTLNAGIRSGLKKNNLQQVLQYNPYIAFNQLFDYENELIDLAIMLKYNPNTKFGLNLKAKYSKNNNMSTFVDDSNKGYFNIIYLDGSKINIEVETFYEIGDNSKLIANLGYHKIALDSVSKEMPYDSPLLFSINYASELSQSFGINIGAKYVDSKYSDIENKEKIKGYFNINLHTDYKLYEDFMIYADFDNLANQDIILWKNYKERSLYASIGIMWQF